MKIKKNSVSAIKRAEPEGRVFSIQNYPGTSDPDQYNLVDIHTKEIAGQACVRTLHNSLWLQSLKPGSKVWCRWLKTHGRFEPYADA